MRVLHLTPELPYQPGGGGGRTGEFFLCQRLVELGHDVLNISPALSAEVPRADQLRDVGVETWTHERPPSQIREAVRAVARRPDVLVTAATAPVRALEMRVFWLDLADLARRAVDEWRPDVAVVGHDMAAAWGCGLPESLPVVLRLHNLTWNWYLSRARRRTGPPAAVLRAEASRYRRHVLRLLPRYRAAIALSTLEAAELRRIAQLPVHVVPIGVDTRAIQPSPEPDGPPRLLFAATLDYLPNSQGIRWFAERVWPAVRQQVPDAHLDVVGRSPAKRVTALDGRDGITVVGSVPEMRPYFERAHAVVVPILTGAGIRVKIIEAMAEGRAIISTSLGWEGLPHVWPGEHLLVADEPSDFAAAVVRVLRDAGLRHRLAAAGRALVEERYDWRTLGDAQEAVLRSVVSSAAA